MTVRTRIALPYRVLRADAVQTSPPCGWLLDGASTGLPNQVLADGQVIESWDYLRPLTFTRSFTFPADLHQRLGLPDRTRFLLVIVAATGPGLVRSASFQREFGDEENVVDAVVRLDSSQLARHVTLTSIVSPAATVTSDDLLAPGVPGARIWEDSVDLQLEDGRGRIPLEMVSFRASFAGSGFEHALFHVEVAPYPELGVEETVRVYLNGDVPAFVDAVQKRQPAAETLLWDAVLRRLVALAVHDEMLAPGVSYDPGTLGANLLRWMDQAFPSMPLDQVRALARSDISRFEAILQSWALLAERLFSIEAT